MGCRGCALAYMGQGHQPQEAHAPRDKEGKSPKGGRHLLGALGRRDSSLGRRPPRRLDLLGPAPPLGPPIYSGGYGGLLTFCLWCSPPPLPSPSPLPWCLAKPCRIATLLHHHHAIVLLLDGVFLNLSLSPCWIKAWETSSGCTCVERGGAVRSALGSSEI